MAVFDEIIDEVKEGLGSEPGLKDITFVEFFKDYKRVNPLPHNLITIGIKKIEIKNKAFGKYLGFVRGNECFGKTGTIYITINIFVPKNNGGEATAEIFSRICNTLMNNSLHEQIVSIECGNVEFDKVSSAFVLSCIMKLEVIIGQQNDEAGITSIIVKGGI